MKPYRLLPILLLSLGLHAQQRTQLPNGWSLTPAGASLLLSSDLPLNIALAPDGIHAAVTNNGNGRQTIDLINWQTQRVTASIPIRKAWLGLAFSKKHPWLYASGGNDDWVIRYTLKGDSVGGADTLVLGRPWPIDKISPTGLTLDEDHNRLYVVTKEDEALYIFDTKTKQLLSRLPLYSEAYTCLFNTTNQQLYISAWGGRKVFIYNTTTDKLEDSVTTEDHPTDMALDKKGHTLFVANANSNSVSVIDIASRKVIETLHTAISPDAPIGSTTNSLALDPKDQTLYIANADNNCLAVFDVSSPGHSFSKGFIPVGWYPTCVRISGNNLLVANGKGMSSMANPYGPSPLGHPYIYKKADTSHRTQYLGSMLKGTLSVIPIPDAAMLTTYTQQVYSNTPYSQAVEQTAAGVAGNPIPRHAGETSPIKYVFYILKENRTYDQVLGDLPQGNGDTSLVLFGRNVTPNAHSIADEFVLLDNFYVDAEVSADGHNWSMAGYATDFTEKTWPTNYSGRGGEYDFDGSRPIANPTKGFIWDYCHRAGVSFRNYGEFMDNGFPTLPVLKQKENYCAAYPGWNLGIQDIRREAIFEADFDSLLRVGALPHFCTIYLPNDHTSGLHKGAYSPIAQVADNDLAFGRLVEHISHSAIWDSAAIFVLEDDAQDGPDHVDAHRSPAYVISPFIKRHSVNHTLYSTTSVLRTMELILGLPPMSQFDAAATPMYSCFMSNPDTTAFIALPALVDINMRNTGNTPSAAVSRHFDLSDPDRVPDALLNAVLWKAIKGEESPVPQPRRSAFVKTNPGR
ncbi:bifunctional YncE family protein/alkaline phosphatase family protein [Puia dinghuensis]|uniref:Lipoprotein n=1 Tax=Puia dinghuensis TaxID=1792502 RepID=A0A8J2UE08_9BACT|nr:bifunctional YncE family protein/alkaline phosphatase family protein [Puia dinghuensis]GGB04730.1 lipoprotein [Puia dinghuensis]